MNARAGQTAEQEKHALRQKKYAKANPHADTSHNAIKKHVKSGKLKRTGKCKGCGKTGDTEFAHLNYDNPKAADNVIELCVTCHRNRERAKGVKNR